MPKYNFQCPCGVRFDRNLKMGEHPTHLCPDCRKPAPRRFAGQGFGFGFAAGNTPGNSGVTKLDYPTADQLVGSEAQARWAELNARKVVKDKVREGGGTHALMRRTVEEGGKSVLEYEAMDDVGFKSRVKKAKEMDKAIAEHGMVEASMQDLKKSVPASVKKVPKAS